MKFTNEKITDFSAMTDEERISAFAAMDNDALTAAATEMQAEVKTLLALDEATIEQVDEAEALIASLGHVEAAQTERATAAKDAADRFAAAKAKFAESVNDGVEVSEDEADDAENDDETDDAEDGADEGDADGDADTGDTEEGTDAVTTASADHTKSQVVKATAARKVGRKTKRPDVTPAGPQVVITAAADVPKFATGQILKGLDEVTAGLINRAKGFPAFNLAAAQAARSASGGKEVLSNKFGVASFAPDFPEALVASGGVSDYTAYNEALRQHKEAQKARIQAAIKGEELTMTAAGWCAPSENVYSWVADFVVDGLVDNPEVKAPRGGLNVTTGPAHVTQGTALDDFGFTQTEAQAEAGTVKTCETIECPDFTDHRLDATGYCYKIPILTQKAYPELITDALRLADVLYAHKVNKRKIADMVALSTDVAYNGYGASFTDTLEAVCLLALRERRKWNIGENAIMTIKAPLLAREVFRADMSRRTGLALTDVATDQKINAEFAARNFDIQYVADWQETATSGPLILQGSFKIMVYPAGTFVTAIEDVINLSTVYDAASLSVNEYTGVFFEQGYMTVKVGYGSNLLTIPINTAGETGAAVMTGLGDSTAGGSF